jgi:predicted secreted protein
MEFLDYAAAHPEWSALVGGEKVTRIDVSDADHTFSDAQSRVAVEDASIAWLAGLRARLGMPIDEPHC